MKLAQAPQDVQVGGNFKTTAYNVGDIALLVDMFADKVYTYKERAVIRELACNAHDSHVMAGTTDVPFDVHLPTQLESWFSIRDYGTGLSDEDVRNVFSGIGISTKRDSNEVIGCFGIGSLSPFSVSDSFTVTSYYNI
jgi:HSP90 family molecular chaperone